MHLVHPWKIGLGILTTALFCAGLLTASHASPGATDALNAPDDEQVAAVSQPPMTEAVSAPEEVLIERLAPAPVDVLIERPEEVFGDLSLWSPEDASHITGLGMHPELNRLQFHGREAMARFKRRWDSASTEGLNIVYVGDSHVQNGVIHRELRRELGPELGIGGHGLLFPYSAAKTYAPRSYTSKHRGAWSYGKSWQLPAAIPLGVVGMSVRTEQEDASFTIKFKKDVPEDWRRLRIYCERVRKSFDLKVDTGGRTTRIQIRPERGDDSPYVEVDLPR
ncbi:MAG: hypothetical protein QF464_08280, partial [Myxococcota bacterium]|nr:hypothetical protein [Myxococcota bacterium]